MDITPPESAHTGFRTCLHFISLFCIDSSVYNTVVATQVLLLLWSIYQSKIKKMLQEEISVFGAVDVARKISGVKRTIETNLLNVQL